jgi:predicted phosphate transport protein (TIGR00153 family)
MFGSGKKEKQALEAIKAHFDMVSQTVTSMLEAVESYSKGDLTEARDRAFKTHELESKSDSLRREIIELMYKGAFFPAMREDIIKYVSRQDKIADRAESCCDFMITQKPKVPEAFAGTFLKLAHASCNTIKPLQQALEQFFEDYNKVRDQIHAVNTKEEEADTVEWHLTDDIFKSESLSLAEKMHLHEFVFHIVCVSDVAEDAADTLDSIVIKRRI